MVEKRWEEEKEPLDSWDVECQKAERSRHLGPGVEHSSLNMARSYRETAAPEQVL